MLRRQWVTAALTTAGLLAAGASARAGDTYRLGLDRGDTPTITLGGAGALDADTYEVGRGGGGHGGGGHGGGGYHGGGYHGGGYHAAYRGGGYGYGGGGYGYGRGGYGYGRGGYGYGRGGYGYGRGWYGYGRGWYGNRGWYGYGPYYGSWYGSGPYYGNWSYSSYWPYYSYPSSAYYGGYYGYPSSAVVVPSVNLNVAPTLQSQPLPDGALETAPPPALAPADGTFPYDGGPRNPPPMPKADPAPTGAPATIPLSGRAVSLPGKATYTYAAYGETPKVVPADRGNTYLIKANVTRPAGR